MTDRPLAGRRILVTRPEGQSAKLVAAIEAAGGVALPFPLLEIDGIDAGSVLAEAARLPDPDIAIFVSPNAVRYGCDPVLIGQARIAAVGPATMEALRERGATDTMAPAQGFDSESLLASPELENVNGLNIRILRGQDGRELLADTLRARGARVDHLAVYRRRARRLPKSDIDRLVTSLRERRISCITIMSVETLHSLLLAMPETDRAVLQSTRLVTPSARVIKTLSDLMPGLPATLAPGPRADDMVLGLVACLKRDTT